jgi:hypothetical protein
VEQNNVKETRENLFASKLGGGQEREKKLSAFIKAKQRRTSNTQKKAMANG